MPERNERFFWLYAEGADDSGLRLIEESNNRFAADWCDCTLNLTSCVTRGRHRLWLFRLGHGRGNGTLAESFNRGFRTYVAALTERLRSQGVRFKRVIPRTNMLTPMLTPRPLAEWPRTDLGLHPVNDQYNGMVVTYSYYLGRFLQPPHLQFSELRKLTKTVGSAWQEVACDCRNAACQSCDGTGCFGCFVLDCPQCRGTGWKNFSRWEQAGYRVNYDSGYPHADFS